MTQSFDEWFKNEEGKCFEKKFYQKPSLMDAFQAGAQSKQAEIDELRKRIDYALKAMEDESENSWGLWKEKADMYEQGASNAYEKSYWILKGTTNEQ